MKVTLSTMKGASDGFLYLRKLIYIIADTLNDKAAISELQTLVSHVVFIAKEDMKKPRTRALIQLYYPWETPLAPIYEYFIEKKDF